ncbi:MULTISPECIES: beta-L-arabinofuranosidase domain-containing protein [unclassified Sphingobacterium]|uniref:beta-L-arabinofuranosidase domain-containing protein n=1 Tax=unclassified Sphingobacterium TaxID=2609468 RepID=UPI0020C579BF|nr:MULTISPECIES: beta-L-arabinofuranosidase domain-containing protein [unclassified Sphingobacterium]
MAKIFGLLIVWIGGVNLLVAQESGDQILDGIGETGMIARYVFDGSLKDWSRNGLHANSKNNQPKFIKDEKFGNVLSLSGGKDDYLTLPAGTLNGLESLSISVWLSLKSDGTGQYIFDFGKDNNQHFFAAPFGTSSQKGFQALITEQGENKGGAIAAVPALNKWLHVAIVVDVFSKNIITYVDGKQVAEGNEIPKEIAKLFEPSGKFNIGKSLSADGSTLNALVHDFRIYRVALTKKQVSGIYFNGQNAVREDKKTMGKAEDNLPTYELTKAQLYNQYLLKVSDVNVETALGELPRLPSFVEGEYKEGFQGPKVRVLWPADIDNDAVLKAGEYVVTGRIPGTDLQPKAFVTVKGFADSKTPSEKLLPFELSQVSLNADSHNEETKFIENRDKFVNTLAKTDPNSFLYMFRHAFGQKQPAGAIPLGVWDSQDTKLRGHATGHYLTAIAQAYASTAYDKTLQDNFAQKMDYMVNTLYDLAQLSGKAKSNGGEHVSDPTAIPVGPGKTAFDSDLTEAGIRTDYWNWGEGFISAYPPDQFIMLENGATYGTKVTQVWAPYYTLHKILAGLIDIHQVSGNKKALQVAEGMGEWVYKRLNKIPKDNLIKMWNTYIAGEFGGMNESMARLYEITKNPHFLATAQLFDNIKMFYGDPEHSHGLAKNVDTFRGLHANQHIPQIVGSIEMYKASNDPNYFKIADNFWYKAVNDYMYSIGGVAGARNPANAECFISQPATLYENGFSAGGQNETCATYNMLKLTSDLFRFDQRAELMDYYERGLYNHILASVAENSPANTYHVSLRPGANKQFGNPDMKGFTCCNGTAIESSTKLQNTIYFRSKDNNALYVNLFIPSTLNWEEKGITITQTTSYPKQNSTRLDIKGNGKFAVKVRVPNWATKGFFVKINGQDQKVEAKPGTYLAIERDWKNGDNIELTMPFDFHLDPVMDQPNIASLFYGPILLAAQETEPQKEWRKVTLDAKDLGKSISGNPEKLEFQIDGVVYKPFYDTYGRHSVYLDVTLK